MSVKIVSPADYLSARGRVEEPGTCTPKNIRTLSNSTATCFLSEDGAAGFYIMSDGFPRGTFGLSTLPGLWLLKARELLAEREAAL
jgi:hypothetical protein